MLPVLLSVGLLYVLALMAGRLSAAAGIPRVTGYLAVGMAAGPSLAALFGLPGLLSREQIHDLGPLHDFILGLIVFSIGGGFGLRAVRKNAGKLFRISAVEIAATAGLVGAGTLAAGAPPLGAAFLAVISITTAPAATQVVMRECRSEGPLTDTILPLIGLNNLAAILAFILLANWGLSTNASVGLTVLQALGPLALGGFVGLGIAVMTQRLARQVERQMLLIAAVAVTVGLAAVLEISDILSTLVAGAVAVNASPGSKRILGDIAAVDYPLYVLFFILAGADLHIASLAHIGFVGGVYVAARAVGKFLGCRAGCRAAGASHTLTTWLGPAMLAQAGLAIGLADDLAGSWPGTGETLQSAVLAAVVVFEVVGPLLTRTALVRAGEVTVLNLLVQRSPVGYREGLHQVVDHFRDELGLSPARPMQRPSDILVGHIMRRNVEFLPNTATFDEVLKALGNSRYDRLPVLDEQGELVGVIKYADIANTLFEPGLARLVVADEIATDDYPKLTPEDTLEEALAVLKGYPDDSYVLVVDAGNPGKLLGVVRHNDLLSTHLRSS